MFGKKSGLEKRCSKCRETKSVKEFDKNKGSQNGYRCNCKACAKKYRQSEKGIKAKKKYRQSEKGREAKKKYDQSEKGREVNRKSTKKYTKTEKGQESDKKRNAIRRTRKTQAGGSYSVNQWYELCKFYDFRCLRCNKQFSFEKLSVDHVKPVSKGGSSDIWNLQPLCGKCNSKKKDKEIDYRKALPDWINRAGPVWQQNTLF